VRLPLVILAALTVVACSERARTPLVDNALRTDLVPTGNGYRIRFGGQDYASFAIPRLGSHLSEVTINPAGSGWQRVRLEWVLDQAIAQDDLSVAFDLALRPDFHWVPHLTPVAGSIIAQHVFRSPAMIVAEGDRTLTIVPELEICGTVPTTPWYLDYDAPARRAVVGMSLSDEPVQGLYPRKAGMVFQPGLVELGFFVKAYVDSATPRNPWREVTRFLWDRYARPLAANGAPHDVPLGELTRTAHEWAFRGPWRDLVWQEVELGRKRIGGAQYLVNLTQSPGYPGSPWSDGLSIWNQSWFCSLRTASGLLRWARQHGDTDLARRAELGKALALSAPNQRGVFPSVMHIQTADGASAAGTGTLRWANADRIPRELGITPEWYHVVDASWTATWMMRWHVELEEDPDLLAYARAWGDFLLTLQRTDGFFPAWLHPTTLLPGGVLDDSPETSASVTFLLELAAATGDGRYRAAALTAMDAVLAGPVAIGRWEDYETYWSDNPIGRIGNVGLRFPRNGVFKQNTLSMLWTVEALLASFRATRDRRYLDWGRRTLDELSMAQQVWEPPFIHVPALGGFGVMNASGEWNDARQSIAAELYMQYYRETGDAQLFERGVAALEASFVMMYTPLLPRTKKQWELAFPFLGSADHGFTMENYAHAGVTGPNGLGIDGFAIFDWGAGAASEAYGRVRDHFGDVYIDRARRQGFGIDNVDVRVTAAGFELRDRAHKPRRIRIVYDDGRSEFVWLAGVLVVNQ
jgi:hypothetical protein